MNIGELKQWEAYEERVLSKKLEYERQEAERKKDRENHFGNATMKTKEEMYEFCNDYYTFSRLSEHAEENVLINKIDFNTFEFEFMNGEKFKTDRLAVKTAKRKNVIT